MKINMTHPKEFYIKIIVILFIILMAVLIFVKFNTDNNSTQITEEQKKELFSKIEKNTNAKVTKFASYGTHFNLEGNIEIPKISGIKINYVDVVIKTLDGTENSFKSNFNYSDNICSFSSSDEINSGLNLEELSLNTYYLFVKVTYSNGDIKYYSLANDSEYGNITYYTITKNNSNNKIDIFFDEYNNLKLMSISVVKASSLPDDVYDIAIDPARGGSDTGSTFGDYTESSMVLQYGLKLKSELENLGLKVYISRTNSSSKEDSSDVYSENGRINLLNASHAKLLISLQLNGTSYSKNTGGVEIYAPSNCNLDFASTLANNIVQSSSSYYSENNSFKKADGVYVRNFTNADILAFNNKAKTGKYEPYNITKSTPYLYLIRETGGISTNAFVDGRNTSFGTNKYYNSNTGIETYIAYLGYMSVEQDLNNLVNNTDNYINGLLQSIKSYCNL